MHVCTSWLTEITVVRYYSQQLHSCHIRSLCLMQHSTLPGAASATQLLPLRHKSHKGLLINFKWFIVAWEAGSGKCYHIGIIWMTSYGGVSSNPWILLAELGFKSLASLPSVLLEALWPHEEAIYCPQMKTPNVAYSEETCHTCTEATTVIWPSDEQRRLLMCCERCSSAKDEAFERVGTPQSAQLDGEQ